MKKYNRLIEFLISDYQKKMRHFLTKVDIPYNDDIFKEFDIFIKNIEDKSQIIAVQYEITSKSNGKKWNIIVATASLLFASNKKTFREKLIVDNSVAGIFTLDGSFFQYSHVAVAVIVLGKQGEDTWLTTAATFEDIITLMENIHKYNNSVFFTSKLDFNSFMPEYYDGKRETVNKELDKYITKELYEIAEVISGKNAKTEQLTDKGIPYLRGRNLQNGAIVNVDSFIANSEIKNFSNQLLEEGDILLQKQFGYHKIARVTQNDLPAIASGGIFIIRALSVSEDYLYSYLTSETGKRIFENQLKNIEHGVIPSIGITDLRKVKVPLFDEIVMSHFVDIENADISKLIPAISKIHTSNLNDKEQCLIGVTQVEYDVYDKFISVGWDKCELIMNSVLLQLNENMNWEPDIAIYNETELIAIAEIRKDFSLVREKWISNMNAILRSKTVPILIISNGTYFEIHSAINGDVKKMMTAPTKDDLLSMLNSEVI